MHVQLGTIIMLKLTWSGCLYLWGEKKRIFQFYVFYVIFYGLYNFHQFIVMAVAICREPNVKFTYSALGNPNSNATIETNLHITVLLMHSTLCVLNPTNPNCNSIVQMTKLTSPL